MAKKSSFKVIRILSPDSETHKMISVNGALELKTVNFKKGGVKLTC